jgi:lipopolysaccharide export system permease protein
MFVIDRYLLRQFVQTFVICFLSLTGLYIVVDLFTNMDQFVRCGHKTGNVVSFIAQYYGYHTILFFNRTSGMLTLVSAMFTVAWIQRHNEMTALMASGVSRIRVLVPIILAVAVVSLLSAANRELVIPRYRNEMSRRPQDPLGDMPQGLSSRYDYKTDVVLRGKNTYAEHLRIEEPNFLLPAMLADYGKQVIAENAYYVPPQGDHPGGYRFEGVREPKNLDTRPSLPLNEKMDKAVLITPRDAPQWLKPGQCFICSDVDFEQLNGDEGAQTFKELSSTTRLIASLRNPSLGYGADVRVAIHLRIVQPLLDMTLLFLGLPLVVTRENRNVFLAMGLSMALTVAFMLTAMGLQKLGEIELIDPALAAWAPLMIFVPLAAGIADPLWK